MKINILLTFDYELPLGGIVKSFNDSLFTPTNRLLKFTKQIGAPITLFADVLSYIRFDELGVNQYTEEFKNQLHEAILNGNDVQLHLHPHWLETEVSEKTFTPSFKYRLSDFEKNDYPNNIEGIISRGVEQLTEICKESNPNYKCIAYRGGGYNFFPDSEKIIASLINNGILIDSSIPPGYYFVSDQNTVDYRKVPNKPNWYLPKNGDFRLEDKEGLYEVPIATIPKNVFELPTSFKLKKYANRAPEPRGHMIHTNSQLSFSDKLRMMFAHRMLTVDNYTYSFRYLNKIFDSHVRKFKNYKEISVALIGHPKSMSDYSFEMLEGFINHVKKKYKSNASFTTFQQLSLSL